MCAKIRVNGEGAHLLFQRLKKARRGLLGSQRITWNFTKFLVGRDGEVLARYGTRRSPSSLDKAIEKALKD
jgi:glutathione peroxidase